MLYDRDLNLVREEKAMAVMYTYNKAIGNTPLIEEGRKVALKEHEHIVYLDEEHEGYETQIYRDEDGNLSIERGLFSVMHEATNKKSSVWFYKYIDVNRGSRLLMLRDLSENITRSYILPRHLQALFVFDGVLYYVECKEGKTSILQAHSNRIILSWVTGNVHFVQVVVCSDYLVIRYVTDDNPADIYQIVHIDFP